MIFPLMAQNAHDRHENGREKGMRNIAKIGLCLLTACSMAACSASADEHVGQAQGYGGTLKVRVKTENGKLSTVEVLEHHETLDVGTRAIDQLPSAMAAAGTWDVDAVSGATITSNAMKDAVRTAMGEADPETTASTQPAASSETRTGLGIACNGRIGPGTDSEGQQVYSFNVVFAQGVFDAEGRVQSLNIDQLEVLTPNGGGKASFSGFPGQGDATEESFQQQIADWVTKGQLGDEYKLTSGSWRQQVDAYQRLFEGKTVDEIEAWFDKFCSEETGRPLQKDTENEADLTKYNALSDEEKSQLADVVSTATISLRDEHGDILTAIRRAWEAAQ